MDRKQKAIAGLDLQTKVGIEIGALDRPLVAKAEGKIINVDYLSTAELLSKYQDDPNVNKPNIVDVDVVTGDRSLTEAMGETKVDYIIASHVIEHVPDVIGWLEELRGLLNPGGELRLVIPDRRFTFDYLRQETRLCDVLNAWMLQAKVPLPHSVIDSEIYMAKVDVVKAWHRQLDGEALERYHTSDEAIGSARDALEKGTYQDVHCWVFTPLSLSVLFEELATLGLLKFSCEGFVDTTQYEVEFFVTLRECADRERARLSWRKLRQGPLVDLDPQKEIIRQLKELIAGRIAAVGELEATLAGERARAHQTETSLKEAQGRMSARLAKLEHEAAAREASVRQLEETLALMNESTSWRLTAPLRSIRNAVLNLKGVKP